MCAPSSIGKLGAQQAQKSVARRPEYFEICSQFADGATPSEAAFTEMYRAQQARLALGSIACFAPPPTHSITLD